MDVTKLKRREPKKKPEAEPTEPAEVAAPEPVSNNLHKPVRGATGRKQFVLPVELIAEFEARSREQGYRNRQDSLFFQTVWEFWKEHH